MCTERFCGICGGHLRPWGDEMRRCEDCGLAYIANGHNPVGVDKPADSIAHRINELRRALDLPERKVGASK